MLAWMHAEFCILATNHRFQRSHFVVLTKSCVLASLSRTTGGSVFGALKIGSGEIGLIIVGAVLQGVIMITFPILTFVRAACS